MSRAYYNDDNASGLNGLHRACTWHATQFYLNLDTSLVLWNACHWMQRLATEAQYNLSLRAMAAGIVNDFSNPTGRIAYVDDAGRLVIEDLTGRLREDVVRHITKA